MGHNEEGDMQLAIGQVGGHDIDISGSLFLFLYETSESSFYKSRKIPLEIFQSASYMDHFTDRLIFSTSDTNVFSFTGVCFVWVILISSMRLHSAKFGQPQGAEEFHSKKHWILTLERAYEIQFPS